MMLLTTSEFILGSPPSVADEANPFLENINTYVRTVNRCQTLTHTHWQDGKTNMTRKVQSYEIICLSDRNPQCFYLKLGKLDTEGIEGIDGILGKLLRSLSTSLGFLLVA